MSGRKDLEDVSEEDLLAELARRRASRLEGDLRQAESELLKWTAQSHRQGLQVFLEQRSARQTDTPQRCPRCGGWTPLKTRERPRTLRSTTGDVTYRRHYYYCAPCKKGFYPLDEELELPPGGTLTPEMERRVLDFGVNDSLEEAAARWEVHYTCPISGHLVHQVLHRQSTPLVDAPPERLPAHLPRSGSREATHYVQVDGSMLDIRGCEGGKEAKLAVLFEETHHVASTPSQRGLITQAQYVASVQGLDSFEALLRAACHARSAGGREVWLADGAPWIWGVAQRLAPDALQILDWFHATDAALTCAQTLFGAGTVLCDLFVERIHELLWIQGPAPVLAELEQTLFEATPAERGPLKELHRYYSTHQERMAYPLYIQHGVMVGSGAIEASHRHVLHVRMRRAGQHWSLQGAHAMAQLRALYQTVGPTRFYDTIQRVAA